VNPNPWAPWGIIHSTRDGFPVLTETALWQLAATHPRAVERVSDDELYVHLDQPYRALFVDSMRSFRMLVPAPGRKPPQPAPRAA
jgi:hypothetical protein